MSEFTFDLRRNRGRVMRHIVQVLALGLSAVCAYVIAQGNIGPIFILAGPAALIGAGIAYRLGKFEYGLMAVLLAAGLINFFTLPTGRESRIVISLAISLVLLAIWGYQLIMTNVTHERIRPSPINKPLLAFVGVNILAYIWSQFMRDPILFIWPSFPLVQIAALVVNIALPLMALATANKIADVKWLSWMAAIVIGLGVLNIVSRLLNLPTLSLIENGSRGLFALWVTTLAYSLALFHHGLKRWHRGALLVLVAAYIFQYFVRDRLWVTGWLPMFIGIGTVTFLYSRRLFVVVCLATLIIGFDKLDDLYKTVIVANADEGGLERLSLWEMNLRHVLNHPIFGMGPAGYAVYNMTYHSEDARSTHNNYFDVLAQTGVVGFIFFLALLGALLRVNILNVRMTSGRRDFEAGFAALGLGGCLGMIVAMMLGDWVLPFAYNQTITGFDNAIYTWILLGCAVSLSFILGKRQQAAPDP